MALEKNYKFFFDQPIVAVKVSYSVNRILLTKNFESFNLIRHLNTEA